MDYSLSNAEFVLLLLIAERPGITGYGIRRLVEDRGLSAWAGVANSSIYNGLKRIEDRGLAVFAPDVDKQDRGPRGRAARLTADGEESLRRAIADSLSSTREHDPRINLALSGVDVLGPSEAARLLRTRAAFLASEHERLTQARATESPESLSADLLFDRILHGIDAERRWTAGAADCLREMAP